MKILSLECTAGPASAAITEDGRVIASSFINVKLTHSQTLLPMAEGLFAAARLGLSDIDGIARYYPGRSEVMAEHIPRQ